MYQRVKRSCFPIIARDTDTVIFLLQLSMQLHIFFLYWNEAKHLFLSVLARETCPGGYDLNPFSQTCYRLVKIAKNWSQADRYCRTSGEYLATFDTLESIAWFKMLRHTDAREINYNWLLALAWIKIASIVFLLWKFFQNTSKWANKLYLKSMTVKIVQYLKYYFGIFVTCNRWCY